MYGVTSAELSAKWERRICGFYNYSGHYNLIFLPAHNHYLVQANEQRGCRSKERLKTKKWQPTVVGSHFLL